MYKNCQKFVQGINKLIPCQKPNFESENRTYNPKMFGPALEYVLIILNYGQTVWTISI